MNSKVLLIENVFQDMVHELVDKLLREELAMAPDFQAIAHAAQRSSVQDMLEELKFTQDMEKEEFVCGDIRIPFSDVPKHNQEYFAERLRRG